MHNPNRPYYRAEIDIEFNKVKAALHAEAVERGEGVALFQDCYTNKTLRGGDSYDYEHIRSSEEVFMKYRLKEIYFVEITPNAIASKEN